MKMQLERAGVQMAVDSQRLEDAMQRRSPLTHSSAPAGEGSTGETEATLAQAVHRSSSRVLTRRGGRSGDASSPHRLNP